MRESDGLALFDGSDSEASTCKQTAMYSQTCRVESVADLRRLDTVGPSLNCGGGRAEREDMADVGTGLVVRL